MAKYYENQNLEYCKTAIKQSCNDTTASFVKIGYYLKQIKDRELYIEDGYQDIWQLAEAEFGISKSTASRFIGINDRFSVDGNSPMLLPEYVGFSSSKLSEMLTLSDKQLEEVKPETTVKEIRGLKQPKKKREISPEEPKQSVATSQQVESEQQESVTESIGDVTKSQHCEAFGYECNLDERRWLAKEAGLNCTAACCCGCNEVSECGCRCFVASDRIAKKEPEVVVDVECREIQDTNEPEHQEQPELPILKNNDQRKAWIEKYRDWPLWLEIEQTGERFFRYDFDNDTSFVIKESMMHKWLAGKYSKDAEYSLESYYILGVTPEGKYRPKELTFRESSTNMSTLVEHLKEIQKGDK